VLLFVCEDEGMSHLSYLDASAEISDEFVLKYFLISPFDVNNKRNGKRFANNYLFCHPSGT